jgi:hypothetical protein
MSVREPPNSSPWSYLRDVTLAKPEVHIHYLLPGAASGAGLGYSRKGD